MLFGWNHIGTPSTADKLLRNFLQSRANGAPPLTPFKHPFLIERSF